MLFGVIKPVLVSELQNCKILTPFVTSQTPNIAQNGPKQLNHHKSRQNDYLFLKFGISRFFGVRKPVLVSEFQNFQILTPFVTSQTPIIAQKCPKKQLNRHKSRQNDHLFLKFGMSMFVGVRKRVLVSEFQNFKSLTPFVTSQTPNYAQYGPKTTKSQ
jgi:hypothetical protein